jgi:hypothetical protein
MSEELQAAYDEAQTGGEAPAGLAAEDRREASKAGAGLDDARHRGA